MTRVYVPGRGPKHLRCGARPEPCGIGSSLMRLRLIAHMDVLVASWTQPSSATNSPVRRLRHQAFGVSADAAWAGETQHSFPPPQDLIPISSCTHSSATACKSPVLRTSDSPGRGKRLAVQLGRYFTCELHRVGRVRWKLVWPALHCLKGRNVQRVAAAGTEFDMIHALYGLDRLTTFAAPARVKSRGMIMTP